MAQKPEPTPANLYRVTRTNGSYFAIHDPASSRLWTERSEQAARAQASELNLSLGAAKSIRHDELMRLLGRAAAPNDHRREQSPSTKRQEEESPSGQHPIRTRAPFMPDQAPPVMLSKSQSAPASAFASDQPVTDASHSTDQDAARDDVLESRAKLPKGIAKNPFADSPKRQRRS
jgi:hypothetical protein